MLRPFLSCCLASLIALSCDDEKEPTPVQFFQVTVDSYYSTDHTVDWLVLQDENGDLLSAKTFEASDVVIFESEKTIFSSISLSVFRYDAEVDYYRVQTYMGLQPGEMLTLKNLRPQFPAAPSQGKLSIKVTDANIGHPFDAALSTKQAYETPESSDFITHTFRQKDVTATFNDFFVFVADNNGNPKYKFLENTTAGTIDFTLADFHDFDKTIMATLPATSESSGVTVQAFETDQTFDPSQGYHVNVFFSGLLARQPRSVYKLGYLNRFQLYYTSIWARYAGFPYYQVSFESKGAAPAGNIILAKADVNVLNDDFENYMVTGTDFDWRSTLFTRHSSDGGNIEWRIYSDKNHVKNFALPSGFLKWFPGFKGDQVEHSESNFNKGVAYEAYVLRSLRGTDELDSYTLTTTTLYN